MPIAAALFLDEDSEAEINELRAALVRTGIRSKAPNQNFPPHVTLAISQSGSLDSWQAAIEKAIRRYEPVEITISHVGWFPLVSVIFLAPVVSQALTGLQEMSVATLQQASGAPDEFYRHGRWVPHITLAADIDRKRLAEAMEIVDGAVSIRPVADRVALANIDEVTGEAEVATVLPLT